MTLALVIYRYRYVKDSANGSFRRGYCFRVNVLDGADVLVATMSVVIFVL